MDKQVWHDICCLWYHWLIFMAPSEDSETWRGGRVQVEEVVSNKDLLSLLIPGEGLDDILEIGVIPWSYKIKEARKDGVQN